MINNNPAETYSEILKFLWTVLLTLILITPHVHATMTKIDASTTAQTEYTSPVDYNDKVTEVMCQVISGPATITQIDIKGSSNPASITCDGTFYPTTIWPLSGVFTTNTTWAGDKSAESRGTVVLNLSSGKSYTGDVVLSPVAACSANVELSPSVKKLIPGEQESISIVTGNSGLLSINPGDSSDSGGVLSNGTSKIPFSVVDAAWDATKHIWKTQAPDVTINVGPSDTHVTSGNYTGNATITITCP